MFVRVRWSSKTQSSLKEEFYFSSKLLIFIRISPQPGWMKPELRVHQIWREEKASGREVSDFFRDASCRRN